MDKPILSIRNLNAHYRTPQGENIYAVNDVSLELYPGEVLGLAGESGCGKSTLIQSALGMFFPPLTYVSGSIHFQGKDILALNPEERRSTYLGSEIAIIPQSALNALNPTRRIGDLAYGLAKSHNPEIKKKEVLERMADRLKDMGLPPEVLQRYPLELSGGMKQRAVIALSTLLNPKVVIADEPTSALDVSTQREVIELILNLMDKSIISSLIFITHELPLLKHIAHKVGVMYAGQIVEWGAAEELLNHPKHPYSKALLESMLTPENRENVDGEKMELPVPLKGAPPNLTKVPNQCLFAERCPITQDSCWSYKQNLRFTDHRLVRCEFA